MHGNVWEWCHDWRDNDESVPAAPLRDPTGPEGGATRCSRGGAWSFSGNHCRAAYRGHDEPGGRYDNTGLRVVCDISSPEQ
jgi:formylglycine-generating enzyme required for sulfatase activity